MKMQRIVTIIGFDLNEPPYPPRQIRVRDCLSRQEFWFDSLYHAERKARQLAGKDGTIVKDLDDAFALVEEWR